MGGEWEWRRKDKLMEFGGERSGNFLGGSRSFLLGFSAFPLEELGRYARDIST